MIPRIEPAAAPMRVLRVARRIRSSKTIMQRAISPPRAAEVHGRSFSGESLYPATTRVAVNISRIRTTSARMINAYYHAAIGTVTAILCNWAASALK